MVNPDLETSNGISEEIFQSLLSNRKKKNDLAKNNNNNNLKIIYKDFNLQQSNKNCNWP